MLFGDAKNWPRAVIVTSNHETSFVVVQNSLEAAEYLYIAGLGVPGRHFAEPSRFALMRFKGARVMAHVDPFTGSCAVATLCRVQAPDPETVVRFRFPLAG